MARPLTRHTAIRDALLVHVGAHPNDLVAFVASVFGMTAAAVHRHLSRLIKEGAIRRTGSRKYPRYQVALLVNEEWLVDLRNLEEHVVWRERLRDHVARASTPQALTICEYAFTEMLNNAIDHSESQQALLELQISPVHIEMTVFDRGVGIFKKICAAFSLDDEHHAVLELAKGKLTTDPERHTGEGVFFTSRAMDTFLIMSKGLSLWHTISGRDFLMDSTHDTNGTYVSMKIDTRSTRRLSDVFDAYADVEGGFTKTIVPVALAKYGDENLVSRSQAKRLLVRLERFREVILDFENVHTIGQGFADEVFRVFAKGHPQTTIRYANANAEIARMIAHVVRSATESHDPNKDQP